MRFLFQGLMIASAAFAAEPFLYAPDTGIETYLLANNWTEGTLPLLKDVVGLPDFEFAARNSMSDEDFAFYRTGVAGESSKLFRKRTI